MRLIKSISEGITCDNNTYRSINPMINEIIESVATDIYSNLDEITEYEHYELYFQFLYELSSDNVKLEKLLRRKRIEIKINFRILELIYNTDLSYDLWDKKEEQVRKLIELTYDYQFLNLWQRSIPATVKNLIFNNKGRLDIRVKSLKDLKRVIESWQSLGITLYWKDIAREIDREFERENYSLRKLQTVNKIIGPLQKYVEALTDLDRNAGCLVNYNRTQLKYDLNRRKRRKRAVVDGRHMRDFQLTRYFKALQHYECEVGKGCYGEITLHHKIPLVHGVSLGGIDHPINYQVLCEIHHEEIETDLLLELNKMEDIEEKIYYLSHTFPEVMKMTKKYTRKLEFYAQKIKPILETSI